MSQASEKNKNGGLKLRSFWGVVLAVSLIANAFVIGHIATFAFLRPPHPPHGGGNPIESFLHGHPELREAYRSVRAERGQAMGAAWRGIRQQLDALHGEIGAEPLALEKIEATQARLRALHDQRQTIADARMRDFIAAIPPEARRDFAAYLAERWRMRRERWLKRDKKRREGEE